MYFPRGLKSRLTGPGNIFVGGIGALSLVFAAIALGWLGIGIAVGVVIVLFFAEIYRDSALLWKEREEMSTQLAKAENDSGLLQRARSEIEDLKVERDDWKELSSNREFGLEEFLEALAAHKALIQVVQQHRSLYEKVHDARVTKMTLKGNNCLVEAVSPDAGLFEGQAIALVEKNVSGQASAYGSVIAVGDGGLKANLVTSELSLDLADDLEAKGSIRPQGFSLVLAGIVDPRYKDFTDGELRELQKHLEDSIRSISESVPGSSVQNQEIEVAQTSPLDQLSGSDQFDSGELDETRGEVE